MQRVKLFKGAEGHIIELEQEINRWAEASGARLLQVTGNIAPQSLSLGAGGPTAGRVGFAPSDVLVTVLYETA
jgi:hypothetical protein